MANAQLLGCKYWQRLVDLKQDSANAKLMNRTDTQNLFGEGWIVVDT